MTWNIWLLITLSSCVSGGSLAVDVTQSSYQAEENHDVTLEWTFPKGSLSTLNIVCEMLHAGVTHTVLLDLHGDVEVSESQDKRFAGRVQFDKDLLKEGRLRVHISRLRPDDSGDYLCFVNTGDGRSRRKCHLNVTAERDRPKPETPNTTSGGRDPSTTGSPSQPERPNTSGGRDPSQKESLSQPMSPGSIALCVLGLIGVVVVVVVGTLLGICHCLRKNQQDSMLPSPSIELGAMLPSLSIEQDAMLPSLSIELDAMLPSPSIEQDAMLPSPSIELDAMLPSLSIEQDAMLPSLSIEQDAMLPSPSIELDAMLPSLSIELDPMLPSLSIELDPMLPSPSIELDPMLPSPPIELDPMLPSI